MVMHNSNNHALDYRMDMGFKDDYHVSPRLSIMLLLSMIGVSIIRSLFWN